MTIKEIIKTNFIGLIGLASVIGFSAFKLTEKNLELQWYEVREDNQEQLGEEIFDPTVGGDCDEDPNDIRCAIQFNNPDEHDLTDLTITQALSLSNVTIQSETFKPE